MNRRSFMTAILAAGAAPAIVKVAHLMPVRQLSGGLSEAALESALVDIMAFGHDPGMVIAMRPTKLIVQGSLGKALWPGIETWYATAFAEFETHGNLFERLR